MCGIVHFRRSVHGDGMACVLHVSAARLISIGHTRDGDWRVLVDVCATQYLTSLLFLLFSILLNPEAT